MLLHWYTFFNMCHTLKYVKIHKYVCMWLLLVCIKGKLVLLLDKTGYVSQETKPKFIDGQNFNFNFHYKLFSIKAVHLSDKLSLTCPRLWPIEDICIGIYMYLNVFWTCGTSWKKLSMHHSFEEIFRKKQRRVNLKCVGNYVANLIQCWLKEQISFQ